MTKESLLALRLRQIDGKGLELEKTVRQIERETAIRCERLATHIQKMQAWSSEAQDLHQGLLIKELEAKDKEIAELKAKLEAFDMCEEAEPEDPALTKASTIAIFDSILFAIENWSTDGGTAPDFSLACQAVLFPLVYDQVMKGNENYYLKKVPTASLEVVKRGREYVKFVRNTCAVGLTDPTAWSQHVPMIAKWLVNDALPLLYGARDDVWERSTPLTLEAIMSWRDKPASRALEFPLVFDAMDLLDRYSDEIREKTNLARIYTRHTKHSIGGKLMRNSIRGLDKWGREAREWSRYEGRLRVRAGSGLIGALESYYTQWQAKPTERLKRDVMTWRLRLHLKWNGHPRVS